MSAHTPTPAAMAAARMIDLGIEHDFIGLVDDDRRVAIARVIDRHCPTAALYEALREALPLLRAAQASWEDAAADADSESEEAACNEEVEKLENAVAKAQTALTAAGQES